VERRHGERGGLPLLPSKLAAADQIQGHADHVEELLWAAGPNVAKGQVVLLVETSKRVRRPPIVGGAEVGSNQAVAIHGVHRELVDLDEPAQAGSGAAHRDDSEREQPPGRQLQDVTVAMIGIQDQAGRQSVA
jgi:hypothetical protein